MIYRDIKKRLFEIKNGGDAAKEYEAWLSNPMTQTIIGIMTLQSQPATPEALSGETAAYQLGFVTGQVDILNRMQLLTARAPEEVPATFEEAHEEGVR